MFAIVEQLFGQRLMVQIVVLVKDGVALVGCLVVVEVKLVGRLIGRLQKVIFNQWLSCILVIATADHFSPFLHYFRHF